MSYSTPKSYLPPRPVAPVAFRPSPPPPAKPAARPLATPGAPKPAADIGPPSPLDELRGRMVKLFLVTGETLEGQLSRTARYELVLTMNPLEAGHAARTRVVCKHALIAAEEVTP